MCTEWHQAAEMKELYEHSLLLALLLVEVSLVHTSAILKVAQQKPSNE